MFYQSGEVCGLGSYKGVSLVRCLRCQHVNSASARMCGQCGGALAAASAGQAGSAALPKAAANRPAIQVGRDPSCAIALPANDSRVSRFHARIWPLGQGRYRIVDDNSANGVFINGQRITSGEFGHGDQVSLGSCPFDLRLLVRPESLMAAHPADSVARQPQGPTGLRAPSSGPLVAGREATCDIVLPGGAGQVSRRHATLESQADGRCYVRDLGSANGVLVNGQRVPAALVAPGDHVSFGSYAIDPFELLRHAEQQDVAAAAQPAWAPRAEARPGRPQDRAAPPLQPDAGRPDDERRLADRPTRGRTPQRRSGRSVGVAIVVIALVLAAVAGGALWLKESGGHGGAGATTTTISPREALLRLKTTFGKRPRLAQNIAGYEAQIGRIEPLARQIISTEGALQTVDRVRSARVKLMGREIPVWERLKHVSPEVASLDQLAEQMHAAVNAAKEIVALRAELGRSSENFQQQWALAESGPSAVTLARSTSAASELARILGRGHTQATAVHEKLEGARRTVESVGAALGVAAALPVVGRFAAMAAEAIGDLESAIANPGQRFRELAGEIAADIKVLEAFAHDLDQVRIVPVEEPASPPDQA